MGRERRSAARDRSLQQWTLTREDAARIAALVLLVRQADPTWAGFTATDQMLRGWLPQAESYLLPDATHLLMIVRPRQVAEALASFFVRSARARPR